MASRWACVLTDEFARQATMETELGIPSALFAPPVRDSIVELGKSQIGFMNLFAWPLFRGVSDILPAMQFTVDRILSNRNVWEVKIEREIESLERQEGSGGSGDGGLQAPRDSSISLRSHSISSLSQSPEHHPPAMLNHPSMDFHMVSARASSTNGYDLSPRSSLGTLPHLAGSLPASIRHSAQGSLPTVFAAGEVGAGEISSRTPSTAYASPPSPQPQPLLRPRRSSNTVPSQLPLGLATTTTSTATSTVTGSSTDHRPSDVDPSVVAVVVTSPSKGSSQSTFSGTVSPSSTPPPPPPQQQQQQQPSSRQAQRHSSEKGSVPSSNNEWQSQTTSPTNVTYSPATEATSFLSETSSERRRGGHRGMNGSSSKSPSVTTSQLEFDNDHFHHSSHHTNNLYQPQQHHHHHVGLSPTTSNGSKDVYGITDERTTPPPSLPLSASDSMMNKTIRHRPSRWRLNFWKNRRKEHSNSSGSSP